MSWLSSLNPFKASTKAIDTVANIATGAVKGIDALWFTEEEKAEFSKQTMQVWLKVQEVTANESSIRSGTRRIIAILFCSVFLLLLLMGCAFYKLDPEYARFLFEMAQSLGSPYVITIVIFYFGYYAISNIIKAKKE